MPPIHVCSLDDPNQFAPLREFFEDDNPGLKLSRASVDGPARLASEHSGTRVLWLFRGEGEVFLPAGYRTQEGDGLPLPDAYQPEPIPTAFDGLLNQVLEGLNSLSPDAVVPAQAILARRRGTTYVGDYSGDLWRLDHAARPWSSDRAVEAALAALLASYREPGHSVKLAGGFEPIVAGDQIVVCPGEAIEVRGRFECLAMENTARTARHVSSVRRLKHLADTAGGCNPDFDPFRRLPLTWCYNYPGETGDGLNWVNSHVVNIPKETSPTHFHPPRGIGAAGGIPQREMYLVLDPAAYRLSTWGREASILIFPNLRDLGRWEQHALTPGTFLYIPPGTGHRGLDVFVNVLTIPGFKPHNEYYLDRDLLERGGGSIPYNENLLGAKNYERIEDLL